MELVGYTFDELKALQRKVKEELAERERKQIQAARLEIQAIADRFGMPLRSLLSLKTSKSRPVVAVRYRHPHNVEQQWTGRGRKPRWVAAWVGEGKSIDLLKVSAD